MIGGGPASLTVARDLLPLGYDCTIFEKDTKPGGLICFTINEGIFKDYGFDKKILDLNSSNKWEEIEFFKSDYIASKDVNAWVRTV